MPEFDLKQNRVKGDTLFRTVQSNKADSRIQPVANPLAGNQQNIGNQASLRLAQSFLLSAYPAKVQAKLTIGQPDDKYEQEADRVAEQVMSMPEPRIRRQVEPEEEEEEPVQTKLLADQITPLIQRQTVPEEEEEEEEPVQTKPLVEGITPLVQRQIVPEEEEEEEIQPKSLAEQISPRIQRQAEPEEEEEEEPIQAKFEDYARLQRQAEEEEEREEEEEEPIQPKKRNGQTLKVEPGIEGQITSMEGSGQPLPRSVRNFFEPRFGYDFSKVHVHNNNRASGLANYLNAHAFTVGKNIVFGRGQYSIETQTGRRLLAHELTHIIQQSENNNSPSGQSRLHENRYIKKEIHQEKNRNLKKLDRIYVKERCNQINKIKGHSAIQKSLSYFGRRIRHLNPGNNLKIYRSKSIKNSNGLGKIILKLRKSNPKIIALESITEFLRIVKVISKLPESSLISRKNMDFWRRKIWKRLKNPNIYYAYREMKADITKLSTFLIGLCRELINNLSSKELWGLVPLKFTTLVLSGLKKHYHKLLNKVTPYYTQMANINILWRWHTWYERVFKGLGPKKEAWERTCNVTSMAMVLNGLGVNLHHFKEDEILLKKIAMHYEKTIKTFSHLGVLRMPDLLQFVVIYLKFLSISGDNFSKRAKRARSKAYNYALTWECQERIAGLFGVKTARKGYILERSIKNYKRRVIREISPLFNSGGQVLVLRKGHFVRFQDFYDKGIIVDDPAKGGEDYKIEWPKARNQRFFKGYRIFMK